MRQKLGRGKRVSFKHARPVGIVAAMCAAFVVIRQFTLRRAFSPHTTEIADFGMLPEHLREGLIAPLPAYMPLIREGGSLAFGVFCAPVFEVMGSSVFALRTANVLWHVLVLVVFAAMAWRLGRVWSVLLFAGLWTLAPPALVKLQQFGWANHLETTLLGGLALLLLARSLGSRGWRPAALYAFGAGLTAGLATFYTYVGLSLFAATLVTAVLVRLWRVGWLSVGAFVLGALLGLQPLIQARLGWFEPRGLWVLSGGDTMSFVLAQAPLQHAGEDSGVLARASRLFFTRLPQVWGLNDPGQRIAALGWTYLGSLAALAALGVAHAVRNRQERPHLRRGRSTLLIGATASVVVHLGACVMSGYETSVLAARYLMPIAPFLMLLACAGAAAWRSERGWVRSAVLGLTVVMAVIPLWMGAWELASVGMLPAAAYRERNLRGYHFLSRMTQYLNTRPDPDLDALLERRPRERREVLLIVGEKTALTARLHEPQGGEPWPDVVRARIAGFPEAAHPWLWEGAGRTIVSPKLQRGGPNPHAVDQQLDARLVAELPAEPRLYHGLGGWLTVQRVNDLATAAAASGADPSGIAFPSACAGLATSQTHGRYGLLRTVPPGQSWIQGCEETWLAVGVGMQLARETLPDAIWPDGEPLLRWWLPGGTRDAEQEAFLCAYHAELAMLAAVASEDWDEADVEDPLDLCITD